MSSGAPLAVNGLWLLASLPEALACRRALGRVAVTQEAVLKRILHANRASDFGRRHRFATLRSVADFQAAVPLADYDDRAGEITAIAAGDRQVLTTEPVLLLAPTSGSVSGRKLIPYTAALQREFRRGIAPWCADLFLSRPALLFGPAYWAVTPAAREGERSAGGLRIGFADDSDYLGPLGRLFARAVQAVPPEVRAIGEMEAFWYTTLLFLLGQRELRLVSVWNPTFLTILLERLHLGWEALADDLGAGRFAPPTPLPPELAARFVARLRPAPARAAQIRAAFSAGGAAGAIHARLWPRLGLVSCWADGPAATDAAALAQLFPGVPIEGKGLLATEGIVSIPRHGGAGCPLALRSHFFEFLPEGGGAPLLAQHLTAGDTYDVVVTTGGGLYRHRLHDRVAVTGFAGECPRLRFLGKADLIADRFGEKLHEEEVRRAVAAVLGAAETAPAFVLVAGEALEEGFAYCLYIEAPGADDAALRQVGGALEERLLENFHYRYCRDLGQLAPLRVFRIDGGGREAWLQGCQARGQRLGDIKPATLHRGDDWSRSFRGRLLEGGVWSGVDGEER